MPPLSASSILDLPDALCHEVLSWSPNSATSNALVGTCSAWRRMRSDPAAVALLLIRRPSAPNVSLTSWCLNSCSRTCPGGASAVVGQVLQLLGATPDSGRAHTASPALLHAMLRSAAAHGDALQIRTVLALPSPPDVNFDDNAALWLALACAPDLGAVQALLECGATPCKPGRPRDRPDYEEVPYVAGGHHDQWKALPLLLQHCPAECRADAVGNALLGAVHGEVTEALEYLLPLLDVQGWAFRLAALQAVEENSPTVLRTLLDRHALGAANMGLALSTAALRGQAACVAALLDGGADVHHGDDRALMCAVDGFMTTDNPKPQDGIDTVALLLRGGAYVTAEVLMTVQREGRAQRKYLPLRLLIEAAAAGH